MIDVKNLQLQAFDTECSQEISQLKFQYRVRWDGTDASICQTCNFLMLFAALLVTIVSSCVSVVVARIEFSSSQIASQCFTVISILHLFSIYGIWMDLSISLGQIRCHFPFQSLSTGVVLVVERKTMIVKY